MNSVVPLIPAMPKVELHIHLEGSMTLARIKALADEAGEVPPRAYDALFQITTLADFLRTLDWICGLVRTQAHVRAIARDFIAYAKSQNLVYVELIVNPGHWYLDHDALFQPLADEFEIAARQGGPDVRLLPSLSRSDTEATALELAKWCTDAALPRIVGFSIDGDERAGSHNDRFASAFVHARDGGLPGTAHAGESSSAEGVREALDVLGVQRIDHGVRAWEEPALVERLVKEQVTLNVCVSSNCALLYPKRDVHPLAKLTAAGVACTINTDDPVVLGLTLNDELAGVFEYENWGAAELLRCQRNAVDAAFCSDAAKVELHKCFDAWAASVELGG